MKLLGNFKGVFIGVAFVLLFCLVAFYILSKANESLEGAITLKRLRCDVSVEGSPVINIIAENTTSKSLRRVFVELNVGDNEKLAKKMIEVLNFSKFEFVELKEKVPFVGEVEVCFARFFLPNRKQIRAAYHP